MAAIKRFFEKKKLDIKFKKAGGGVKLSEDTHSSTSLPCATSSNSYPRAKMGAEARRAGDAALSRTSQPKKSAAASGLGTSMGAIRAQVQRELEEERKSVQLAQKYASSGPQEVYHDMAPVAAVAGIFYHCPLIGDEVLPKEEMEGRIEEFLLGQLGEEPEMTSALMIHTMNKNKDKVNVYS